MCRAFFIIVKPLSMFPLGCVPVYPLTGLLIKILLNVDNLKMLLLAQRVSKAFKRVITGSMTLQEELFISPIQVILRADFRLFLRERTPYNVRELFRAQKAQTVINTLLQPKFPAFFSQWHQDAWNDLPDMQSFAAFTGINAFLTNHDGWPRMLVYQPPIYDVPIALVDVPALDQVRYRKETIRYADGIRMGPLYEIVRKFMSPGRFFGVDWAEETWETYDSGSGASFRHRPLPKIVEDMKNLPGDVIQHRRLEILHLGLRANDKIDPFDDHGLLSELHILHPH